MYNARRTHVAVLSLVITARASPITAQRPDTAPATRTAAEVVAAARDEEWRSLDPENTVYFELAGGRVVLELAPGFAPRHVENIRALVRGGYFDGGAVRRSQDNYVAQWATHPLAENAALPADIASALPAEFEVPASGSTFTPVPDRDVYAPEAGFVRDFPVGRDRATGVMWMAHCYGVVGVARGNDPNSGNGSQLYAVIGQAPRHLDRNLTMVGRVVAGMEHLSTLPRGTGNLGFYESLDQWAVISSATMGSDLPPERRAGVQVLRTDSPSFRDYILAARSRTEEFFVHSPERIGLCNVTIPTRPTRTPG